ncbi:MAG: class II fructose-bisphosphate aldolase [Christensenellales bacterium]|jgi:fructose-bisphosphate aldolase class II
MLVSMKALLDRASAENYAIAAPNVSTELDARAALEAAEELNAPLILDVGHKANKDPRFFIGLCAQLAAKANVPVAVNLDHGAVYEHAILAIQGGATSVMIDRSSLPYEENVAQVAELVKVAHAVGVSVESELGHVGQGSNYAEDGKANLTDPDQAMDFIQKTGIDCLAVAIGTAHGAYVGTPKLDFDRLEAIKKATDNFPLVLHGGSGTGDENLGKACRMGINKVNLSNDLCKAAAVALQAADLSGNNAYQVWKIGIAGWKARLKELIVVLGGEGKAWTPEHSKISVDTEVELEEKH